MLIESIMTYVRARLAEERGQTLVEYGLILVLISIAAVVMMEILGGDIKSIFTSAENELEPNTSNGD